MIDFFKDFFLFFVMCIHRQGQEKVCVHEWRCCRGHGLELQVVANRLMSVLGIKLGSFSRAVCAANH